MQNQKSKKIWVKPTVTVIAAGSAEATRSVGTPDSKFGKPGGGGQFS